VGNGGEQIHPKELRELSRVDRIGLGGRLPDQLDLARVGDADGVPECLELIVEPLPVERGFQPHRHWCGQRRKEITERFEHDGHAPHLGDDAPSGVKRARADIALVQIQSDESHPSLARFIR